MLSHIVQITLNGEWVFEFSWVVWSHYSQPGLMAEWNVLRETNFTNWQSVNFQYSALKPLHCHVTLGWRGYIGRWL